MHSHLNNKIIESNIYENKIPFVLFFNINDNISGCFNIFFTSLSPPLYASNVNFSNNASRSEELINTYIEEGEK
jgi:hypothetical protein